MEYMEIFHQGAKVERKPQNEFDSCISEIARKKLYQLFESMEQEHRSAYLFFDLDGTLIKAGIETPACQQTLEQYTAEHRETFEMFKKRIEHIQKFGLKIGICTGRGATFSRKIVERCFPKGSVETIVCEGGAIVISRKQYGEKAVETQRISQNVNQEDAHILQAQKEQIIAYATQTLQGSDEGGKEMIVSLNPPVPYDTNMPAFFESIKNFCARSGMLEHVEITHSATAIDIAPRGVNKMQALQEVLNGDMSLYFGDAKNDEEAMGISVVNSVPDNASESTKDTAKRSSSFGLLSKKSELAGVVDALWNVELYFRFVKIKHKQQSTPQSK